jgi:hypothetical protein
VNPRERIALINRLRQEPEESEWIEFKENHHEPQLLGEYLSALSDGAKQTSITGKSRKSLKEKRLDLC